MSSSEKIFRKALKIARTPKVQRVKTLIPKSSRKTGTEFVPLSEQKWFRALCDKWVNQGVQWVPKKEKEPCTHFDCRHREGFHSDELPTSSGHVPKSDVYEFLRDGQGKIFCVGVRAVY